MSNFLNKYSIVVKNIYTPRYIPKNKFIIKKSGELFMVYSLNNRNNRKTWVATKESFGECNEYVKTFFSGIVVREEI